MRYVFGPLFELWILMVADDFAIQSTGTHFRPALLGCLWLLVVLRVPLSWKKVRCGVELEWVGYSALTRELSLGIKASRCE